MKKIKVGLLPLYIKLYDDVGSDKTYTRAFYDRMAGTLKVQGFDVIKTENCRIKEEFKAAVNMFEKEGADVIVTLHAAYSPSLESIDALAGTELPIVVLDSTEAFSLNKFETPNPISNNHGIHGVMDMCCMLRRNDKAFAICAGHVEDEKMWEKLIGYVKAAASAKAFCDSTVGIVGGKFDGMEDFSVPEDVFMSRFGIKVVKSDKDELLKIASEVTDEEINAEVERELKLGKKISKIEDEAINASAKTNIVLRKWIESKKLDALTVNFLNVANSGLDTMPFMGACFAMQDGIGYAGEGDTFTASLVGALLKNYEETSFIEIFCPDWKNGTLFISHMGEMNYRVA